MDLPTRRALLATRANPGGRLDYLVTLEGVVGSGGPLVEVRYVPDRLVLDAAAFAGYLAALGGMDWESPEQAAVTLLEDLVNEAVPRWLRVTLTAPGGPETGGAPHSVMIEDRQPKWDNPTLLGRLRRV